MHNPSRMARSVSSRICTCSGTKGLKGVSCVLMKQVLCYCTRGWGRLSETLSDNSLVRFPKDINC